MARASIRELGVWANGLRVGTWRQPARAAQEFQYDPAWLDSPNARPLSLSLPLPFRAQPIRSKAVEAFFDNLLPENEQIRRRLQQRFHTDSSGAFDLLTATGRDCVGALQIVPAGEEPARVDAIDAVALTDAELAREISRATSTQSALDNHREFRISIAGVQEKTAFLRHENRWCSPFGSTPTTHIFKLPLGVVGEYRMDMTSSVENEWLCARIAAAYGLPVATCEIARFGPHKVLVVERFDRALHASGTHWLRLPQEDFAQATGTPWHRKYQSEGGPGLLRLADILRGAQDPQRDLGLLFRAQLLFYLLAGIDGHAKNFSIRLLAGGHYHLTPLYDVLSAWPIIGRKAEEVPYERAKLAMALPGSRPHYHLKTIQRRHFEDLAKRFGLMGADAVIEDMLTKTPQVLKAVPRGMPRDFPPAVLERVLAGIERHAAHLAGGG
jgi:serine/threonine-protein kinase HipA